MTNSASSARTAAAITPRLALFVAAALIFAACDDSPIAPEPQVAIKAVGGGAAHAAGTPLSWSSTDAGTGMTGVWGTTNAVYATGFSTVRRFNGATWTDMSPPGAWMPLYGVGGTSDNDVFVVGILGTIYHWDGTDWSSMASGTSENLWGVFAIASNNVFVTGFNGKILHYDGTSWSSMTSGSTEHLKRIWGTAANDVFTVGTNGAILHYDGTSWSTMTSGTSEHLFDIAGYGPSDVMAVGVGGKTLRYDGSTWTAMSSSMTNPTNSLMGVARTSVSRAYAVADDGSIHTWNGTAWSLLATPVGAAPFLSIWARSDVDVFAVSQAGHMLRGTRPVTSVAITPSDPTLYVVGQTVDLTGEALDGDGLGHPTSVVWSSSDESVATVDEDGLVTAVSYGVATITGTAGDVVGQVTVTVSIPPVPMTWTQVYSNNATVLADVWGTSANNVLAAGYTHSVHFDGNTATELNMAFRRVYAAQPNEWYGISYPGNGTLQFSTGNPSNPISWTAYNDAPDCAGVMNDVFRYGSNGLVVATGCGIYYGNSAGWGLAEFDDMGLGDCTPYAISGKFNPSDWSTIAVGSAGPAGGDTPCTAGWVQSTSLGTFENRYSNLPNARALWRSPSGIVWIVGSPGTLARVSASGDAMTLPSGGTMLATLDIYDVMGTTDNDVFFVGASGTIAHYDGTSISIMTPPDGSADHFTGIWVSAAREVFIVSTRGRMYRGGMVLGVPTLPTVLTATSNPNAVQLEWNDNANNEAQFQIERATLQANGFYGAWTLLATIPANAEAYNNAPIPGGERHRYRIRSCNYAGCSSWSNTASGTPSSLGAPVFATNLSGTGTSTQIALQWNDNSSDESRFQVRRRDFFDGGWGDFDIVATTAANATSFVDNNVQPASRYRYSVRACKAILCSPWSEFADVRTASVPNLPTQLTAVALETANEISWSDMSTDELRFEVQRSMNPGSGWSAWADLAQLGMNANSLADNSVNLAITYRYRVRACSDLGCSAWTAAVKAIPPIPATPTGVTTQLVGDDIVLSWGDVANETYYEVKRRVKVGNGAWSPLMPVARRPGNATSYTDTDVDIGSAYRYMVKACNSAGCSALSVEVRRSLIVP
jgi:hypothetical protein